MENSASLLLGQIEQELSALRQHTGNELEQKVLCLMLLTCIKFTSIDPGLFQ